jgi:hypothetical protein
MTTDPGARPLVIDEHLLESVCQAVEDFGDPLANRLEEGRDRRRADHFPAVVIIAKTEAGDVPIGPISVKIKGLEGKSG